MAELADISDALESLASRQNRYGKYRDYYAGKHPLNFSTDQWHLSLIHI